MPCVHLKQLYQLCQENDVRLSSSDLINVMCKKCGKEEVCPDTLVEGLDSIEHHGHDGAEQPRDTK